MKLELSVERLAKSGEGVAHHSGRTVFVEGAVPGDKVLALVEEQGKVLRGSILDLLVPGADRRTPPCPIALECGGCDWMQLTEAAQRTEKEEIVVSALEHLGGIARGEYERLPTVFGDRELGYRRRAVMHPVGGRLGFNARKSHQRVIVERCPALTPALQSWPAALSDALGSTGLKEVDEVHLLESQDKVAIALKLKDAIKPKLVARLEPLVRAGVVQGVVLIPLSGPSQVLGDPVLREASGALVRPDGFSQANALVNAELVQRAVQMLEVASGHSVLELYSGNGNFTLELAARAKDVVAVESSAISVGLAQALKLSHVRFVQGDAAEVADGLIKEGARFERLLLDPPRAGAAGVHRWAQGILVERVVYVACDPASLARDAGDLARAGYQPQTLQLFDLFPQTRHIEAVMSFVR